MIDVFNTIYNCQLSPGNKYILSDLEKHVL